MFQKSRASILCALLAVGWAVVGFSCGDDGGTGPGPDTTPPEVQAVLPLDGAELWPVSNEVRVTFSEDMDDATMVAGALIFTPPATGSYSYSSSNHILTFTPTSPLQNGVDYTVEVDTTVTDEAGNQLEERYSWDFSTYIDTVAPTVDSTFPADGNLTAPRDGMYYVYFSEDMAITSGLLDDWFTISPSVPVTMSIVNRRLSIHPSVELDSAVEYTCTITTSATDTAGNAIVSPYVWTFETNPDLTPPSVSWVLMDDHKVISDTVTLRATASDASGIDRIEFWANGVMLDSDDVSPYQYDWLTDSLTVGQANRLVAIAYDNQGFSAETDTLTLHYLWQEILYDVDEAEVSRDISRVYVRSSDSLLEFRVETNGGWSNYTAADTSGIDCGFFLDIDQNSSTGRDSLSNGIELNGMGADRLIVVGYHGDSLSSWSGSQWTATPDDGLVDYLSVPDNSNAFQVSVRLDRLNNPTAVNLLMSNFTLYKDPSMPGDPGVFKYDWGPDLDAGVIEVLIDHLWDGVPAGDEVVAPSGSPGVNRHGHNETPPSPFE